MKARLGQVAEQVKDPLEIIPAEHAACLFMGKPPKRRGLAWIHDGTVSGLNRLVQEHGPEPLQVEKVVDPLRDAYTRNAHVSRFCATLQGRDVVVTPSARLEKEAREIIEKVVHH